MAIARRRKCHLAIVNSTYQLLSTTSLLFNRFVEIGEIKGHMIDPVSHLG